MALTAWDLSSRLDLAALNLRDHAHAFGYTGQLITKSRRYFTTFTAMRTARAEYMKQRNTGEPVAGTFHYDGRGYDDPRRGPNSPNSFSQCSKTSVTRT